MSTGSTESTYPDSWDNLPGTKTQKPGPEHDKAVAQEYTLDDGGATANPVAQGEHVREKVTPGLPTGPTGGAKYF
jgi:hypothetical protein